VSKKVGIESVAVAGWEAVIEQFANAFVNGLAKLVSCPLIAFDCDTGAFVFYFSAVCCCSDESVFESFGRFWFSISESTAFCSSAASKGFYVTA